MPALSLAAVLQGSDGGRLYGSYPSLRRQAIYSLIFWCQSDIVGKVQILGEVVGRSTLSLPCCYSSPQKAVA